MFQPHEQNLTVVQTFNRGTEAIACFPFDFCKYSSSVLVLFEYSILRLRDDVMKTGYSQSLEIRILRKVDANSDTSTNKSENSLTNKQIDFLISADRKFLLIKNFRIKQHFMFLMNLRLFSYLNIYYLLR